MKITICASIAFYDKMMAVKNNLEALGHEVDLPPSEIKNEQGEMISVSDYYDKRKQKKIIPVGYGTEKKKLLECILKK